MSEVNGDILAEEFASRARALAVQVNALGSTHPRMLFKLEGGPFDGEQVELHVEMHAKIQEYHIAGGVYWNQTYRVKSMEHESEEAYRQYIRKAGACYGFSDSGWPLVWRAEGVPPWAEK